MAETGLPVGPPVLRGAIVQITEGIGTVIPNVIPFQYNPETITRSLKPWNPFDVDPANRASPAPQAAPYDPEETFDFTLQLDATNDLEDGNPVAQVAGVAARIASIQKLVTPSKGLLGDLIGTAKALAGRPLDKQAERSSIPIALLVLGPGTVLPVRVTTLSIEITEMNARLYPLMAAVTLSLRVLTPESFKCKTTPATELARAAYELTRLQEDALAIANVANALSAAKSMLPI